jgi:hypothetical protein
MIEDVGLSAARTLEAESAVMIEMIAIVVFMVCSIVGYFSVSCRCDSRVSFMTSFGRLRLVFALKDVTKADANDRHTQVSQADVSHVFAS